MMMRPLPSSPPGLEAALMLDPGPGEVSAAAAALLPALPEFVEPLFLAGSNPSDRSLWPTLPGSGSS